MTRLRNRYGPLGAGRAVSTSLPSRGWRERLGLGPAPAPAPVVAYPPLALRSVERILALYVAGLTDGALVVAEAGEATREGAFTDGQTIFLPGQLVRYPTRAANLRLYKVLIAHTAAQLLHGTLEGDARGETGRLRAAPEPELAARLFDIVEGARLAARLAAGFPGLGRDLAALVPDALAERPASKGLPPRAQLVEALAHRSLTTEPDGGAEALPARWRGRRADALALLPAAAGGADWGGRTLAESVALALDLYAILAEVPAAPLGPPLLGRGRVRLDRLRREGPMPERLPPRPEPPRRAIPEAEAPRPGPALMTEGQGGPPPLPNEEPRAGADRASGRQVAVSYADPMPQFSARLVPLSEEEKRGAFVYPEWDTTLGAYRPEWCALRPRRLRATGTDWVERVLRRHHAQVQTLKRQFETLRPERLRLRRQDDGDDLDLDVVVESYIDRRLGLPPGERPYARTREERRDIAVAFLIDLSGSTGGWIGTGPGGRGGERVIDVAKQALVLLCEALATLDDRYAIYGFSGSTRKGCEFYTVKDFADDYGDETKARLGGLIPLSYTRLGPPIRHTTTLLQGVPARVKLLMLLSDGRPNDFDAYGGEYGVEDTRKALLEARGRGIRTFCLTIDAEARDYMPRLFGRENYVTLAQVAALPRKLPDLYRRLTVG